MAATHTPVSQNPHDLSMSPYTGNQAKGYGYGNPKPRVPRTEGLGVAYAWYTGRARGESYSSFNNTLSSADSNVRKIFPATKTSNPLRLLSDARRTGFIENDPKLTDKMTSNDAYKAVESADAALAKGIQDNIQDILKSKDYRQGLATESAICRQRLDELAAKTKGRPDYGKEIIGSAMITEAYRPAEVALKKCHENEAKMLVAKIQANELKRLQDANDALTPDEQKLYSKSSPPAVNFKDLTTEEQEKMSNDSAQLKVFQHVYEKSIKGDKQKQDALKLKYGKDKIAKALNNADFGDLKKIASQSDDIKALHAQICAEELLSPFHKEEDARLRKGIDVSLDQFNKQHDADLEWASVVAQQNPQLIDEAWRIHREACNKKIEEEKKRLEDLQAKQIAAGTFTITVGSSPDQIEMSEEFLLKHNPDGLPSMAEFRAALESRTIKEADISFRFQRDKLGRPFPVTLSGDGGMYFPIPDKMTQPEVRRSPIVRDACDSLIKTIWAENAQNGVADGNQRADLVASSEAHAEVLIRAALAHVPPFKPENIKLTIREDIKNINSQARVVCEYGQAQKLADAFPESVRMAQEFHAYNNYQPAGSIEEAVRRIPEFVGNDKNDPALEEAEFQDAMLALDEIIATADNAETNPKAFSRAVDRCVNATKFAREKTWMEYFSGRTGVDPLFKIDEKYSEASRDSIKAAAIEAKGALGSKREKQLTQSLGKH